MTAKTGQSPTVTAVIKFLKAAGFQHSKYTNSKTRSIGSGASVREHRLGVVSVRWREGDLDFFERMHAGGYTNALDVPAAPEAHQRAVEYADALASRYAVTVEGSYVLVAARAELPARPVGVPYATAVRRALRSAGLPADTGDMYKVVDQPDHTRVSILDEAVLDDVQAALREQGWKFEESGVTLQHRVIQITGSMPDRRSRLRKLRAARAIQTSAPTVEETSAPTVEEAPAAVLGPLQEPERPQETATTVEEAAARPAVHYSAAGVAYTVGMRVTVRDRSGMWNHGKIHEIAPDETKGALLVHFVVDAYQVAPRRRPVKGGPNRAGPRRSITPAPRVVPLDDPDLAPEQTL